VYISSVVSRVIVTSHVVSNVKLIFKKYIEMSIIDSLLGPQETKIILL